jgi:hypothetical protein
MLPNLDTISVSILNFLRMGTRGALYGTNGNLLYYTLETYSITELNFLIYEVVF